MLFKKLLPKLMSFILILSIILVAFTACKETQAPTNSSKNGNYNGIIINEVSSENEGDIQDDTGKDPDWIEFYNSSDSSIDLKNCYISKDSKNLKMYQFKHSAVIGAKQFLLVFASNKTSISNLNEIHLNFKISSHKEETIFLCDPKGKLITKIIVPPLSIGSTYGLLKDKLTYLSPSPNKENTKENLMVATPLFSVSSGFYSNNFSLSLSSDNNSSIYYTADGSVPTQNSSKYQSAILITNELTKNNLSKRTDISTQSVTTNPNNELKSVVIRARCYDNNGKAGPIKAATYFLGNVGSKLKNLPTISLTADPTDLFSKDKGIYVLGEKYEKWIQKGNKPAETPIKDIPANFNQRGEEFERPAHIDYFDSKQNHIFSQDIGIRIQGFQTRNAAQKSFNFYARNEYSGNTYFKDSFFGTKEKIKSVTLSAGGEDISSKMRNAISNDIISNNPNVLTQKSTPSALFIDGEFWGIYQIQEKYSSNLISKKYNVSQDNVVAIKNYSVAEGNENDLQLYNDLVNYYSKRDFSNEVHYQNFSKKIDISSFIDYFATNLFTANTAIGNDNSFIWRTRSKEDSKFGDCKWRFAIYDNESSLATSDINLANSNILDFYKKYKYGDLFFSLMKNENFKSTFLNRLTQLLETNFSKEETLKIAQNYYNSIKYLMSEQNNRFARPQNFEQSYNSIQTFLSNRPIHVINHVKETFKINSELTQVTIATNNSSGGKIILNNQNAKFKDNKFSANYLTNLTSKLEAIPNKGYYFAGWENFENTDQIYHKTIEFKVTENKEIKAVFKKGEAPFEISKIQEQEEKNEKEISISNLESELTESQGKLGLSALSIVILIICTLIVVCGIGVLIFYFYYKRKGQF